MKQLPKARFQAAFLVSPCRGKAASRLAILCGIACGFAIFVSPARAQQSVYTLDPAQTKIEFTVDLSCPQTLRTRSYDVLLAAGPVFLLKNLPG